MDSTETNHRENGQCKSFTAAALGFAATALDMGEKAVRAKLAVDHAIEDGLRAANEAVRKGRYSAEDFVDEATLRIRQSPWSSVGWAFAGGAFFGGAILYVASRLNRNG